jgi:ribA/ribD-fused uncharacterized protein
MSDFHMFWGGPFSQWYPSTFEVEGVKYNCTEQYMMAKKAQLFGDEEAISRIMASNNPKEQKRIGRTVKDFVAERWNAISRDVVFRGNMAKFTQDPALQRFILATGDQEIVEASPEDTIWGIGLAAEDPLAQDRATWKGTNWLGEVIMSVRSTIRSFPEPEPECQVELIKPVAEREVVLDP